MASDVDYTGHLSDGQIEALQSWLNASVDPGATQWRPIAMKGSIGVGKTHWLQMMSRAVHNYERDAGEQDQVLVSLHVVTGGGMRVLSVGALLAEALSTSAVATTTLRAFRESTEQPLLEASPLTPLLKRLRQSTEDEAEDIISLADLWLRRGKLTPAKLTFIGVADRLEVEGQWIRALAHAFKLARALTDFSVCIFLLDQLEDLWVRDVTTPLRRARFLSDLRLLIDEGFLGSPIAVGMAWNTALASADIFGAPDDVEVQLRRDYYALFNRIHGNRVVAIPPLPRAKVIEFALAYASKARRPDRRAEAAYERFCERLRAEIQGFVPEGRTVTPRDALAALRAWAEQVADHDTD